MNAKRDIDSILSVRESPFVRPSLCPPHAGIVSKRLNLSWKLFHRLIALLL